MTLTDVNVRARDAVTHIEVPPQAVVRDVRRRIVEALHRNADVDARLITVAVSGETATLTGTAASWLQRESVERAAANAPGIARVENRIEVEDPYGSFADESEE
jgi:osmotically-inducible protein OsmY